MYDLMTVHLNNNLCDHTAVTEQCLYIIIIVHKNIYENIYENLCCGSKVLTDPCHCFIMGRCLVTRQRNQQRWQDGFVPSPHPPEKLNVKTLQRKQWRQPVAGSPCSLWAADSQLLKKKKKKSPFKANVTLSGADEDRKVNMCFCLTRVWWRKSEVSKPRIITPNFR